MMTGMKVLFVASINKFEVDGLRVHFIGYPTKYDKWIWDNDPIIMSKGKWFCQRNEETMGPYRSQDLNYIQRSQPFC